MTFFLDALKCRNQSGNIPMWLMRQAGRYLPEYRELRSKYPFKTLYQTPEIASKITQMPLKRFPFDAAILFSDILVIAESLGSKIEFQEGVGPVIQNPISTLQDIQSLNVADPNETLSYVSKTISQVKPQLKVPLIGFCGAPFTVASYMIEGKSSRDFKKTKQWLLRDPHSFHQLLKKITLASIQYLEMQREAGVDAIQIFESWSHVLARNQFSEFSLHYVRQMIESLHGGNSRSVPILFFSKGTSSFLFEIGSTKADGLSLDWSCSLWEVRKLLGKEIALQGNLDPQILYAPLPTIQKEVKSLIQSMKGDPGYIFNLGHGILPDVSLEAVQTMVDSVKDGN